MRYVPATIPADNLLLTSFHPVDGRWVTCGDVTALSRGIISVARTWRRARKHVASFPPPVLPAVGPVVYWFDGTSYWAIQDD